MCNKVVTEIKMFIIFIFTNSNTDGWGGGSPIRYPIKEICAYY